MKLKSKPQINVERSSTIFGLMFVVMLLIVASILLSKELIGSIKFLNRVSDKYNASEQVLKNNADTLPELKSNYEILQREGPNTDKVLRALPTSVNFPGLATLIEQMSAFSNVELTTISVDQATFAQETIVTATPPSEGVADTASSAVPAADGTSQANPVATKPVPEEVNFEIGVNGKYPDVVKFIVALEKSIRPMQIANVAISAGEDGEVVAKFNIKTYFQKPTLFKPTEEVVR
jgi:Tfp pilus assembly protein PilO